MAIFFTSDTHFNQERTFEYSRRGMYFDSVEHATEEMVKRWNDVVGDNDTVFHLGDFGDFEVAKRLNGHIILLYGNYERDGVNVLTDKQRANFWEVRNNLWLLHVESNLLLVHEPSNYKHAIKEATEKIRKDVSEAFYLFGHIHEKQKVKRNGLNVGVDVHNYTPVNMETIEFYRNAVTNIYDEECFDNF